MSGCQRAHTHVQKVLKFQPPQIARKLMISSSKLLVSKTGEECNKVDGKVFHLAAQFKLAYKEMLTIMTTHHISAQIAEQTMLVPPLVSSESSAGVPVIK